MLQAAKHFHVTGVNVLSETARRVLKTTKPVDGWWAEVDGRSLNEDGRPAGQATNIRELIPPPSTGSMHLQGRGSSPTDTGRTARVIE
jgi:hypothetical protein